jgi:hypothetical protein
VSTASDERIADPQEELEPQARDRVEVLENEEREEDHAEADFDEDLAPEAASHFEEVVAVVGAIFRDEDVDFHASEGLSDDEQAALEVLQEVVRGKDHTEERMLYAEERLAMLNHVLAVLQPTLAMGLTPDLIGLRDEYDGVVEQVVALRHRLEQLDGAQEEVFEQDKEEVAEAPDTDDKPDDTAAEEPAEKQEDKKRFTDFFRRKKPAPPSSKPPAPPRDPDDDSPRPSTLYGEPGEPEVEKPPFESTLGDD